MKRNLTEALLLQVAHNAAAAQRSSLQNLFDLVKFIVLQRNLEQVVRVVNRVHLHFALSSERKDLVTHEESHVHGLVNAAEGTGSLALKEHVLDVGGGRVNKAV